MMTKLLNNILLKSKIITALRIIFLYNVIIFRHIFQVANKALLNLKNGSKQEAIIFWYFLKRFMYNFLVGNRAPEKRPIYFIF